MPRRTVRRSRQGGGAVGRVAAVLRGGRPLWIVVGLAAAVAAGLGIAFARAATAPGGGSVLPLDDPYIYFVYARNTAAGHFLAYNPGDPPSSGGTSTLWTLLLAAGFRLGVPAGGAVAWCLALAAACLAAYLLVFVLCCRTAGAGWTGAGLAAVATAVYGRFAWGAFSGLEIPLSALAVGAVALALLRAGDGPAVPLLCGALILVRPDIGLAAVPAALLWAVERRRTRNLWALLPAATAVVFDLAWRWAGHQPATNGTLVKTRLFAPGAHLAHLVAGLVPMVRSEIGHLLTVHGLPGPAGWVLLALALPAVRMRAGRALLLLALAGLGVEALAFGQGVVWIQFGRYDLPYVIALALAAAVSLADVAARLKAPLWPVALAVLLVAATTLRPFLAIYAENSGEIRHQQIAASAYIARSLPVDAIVMLNDAGAMNYFGGRYTLDLEGLGTNGFALPMRSGTGSTYEHLLDFLATRPHLQGRPLYFAVYPTWFPGLDAAFGPCPAAFTVPHPTILGGPTAVLCRADLPAAPEPGFRVADLAADQAHGYTADSTAPTWLLRLPGPDGAPAIRSGRSVFGAESFRLSATPGAPLTLTAVTTELNPVHLTVEINGQRVGGWDWPAAPGRWETESLAIPVGLLTSAEVQVTLDGPERLTSVYRTEAK